MSRENVIVSYDLAFALPRCRHKTGDDDANE